MGFLPLLFMSRCWVSSSGKKMEAIAMLPQVRSCFKCPLRNSLFSCLFGAFLCTA